MVEEFESKKELKESIGPSTGTYTGTVVPSDLDEDES